MTSKRGERSSGGLQHIWAILYYLFCALQLTMHWSSSLMLLPDYCYRRVKLQFLTRPIPTDLQQTL